MRRKYSLELARAIEKILKKTVQDYSFSRTDGTFCFVLPLGGFPRYVEGEIRVHDTDLNIYGLYPWKIPLDSLGQLLVFLAHANQGRRSGNFELSIDEGQLRYKCFLDCAGLEGPTPEMVINALNCIELMFLRYSLGIHKLLWEELDAQQALALCDDLVRSYYCVNNEATPAESAAAAGIRVPLELLQEDDSDLLELLRDMRAEDNIL
ncbi:MAG: hypothetical protein J6J12_01595 [Oscillospiraceae bacterium]|nr:hypothetical protein [Oscillospiraceae bacterium]